MSQPLRKTEEAAQLETADDLNAVLIATLQELDADKISYEKAKSMAAVAGKIIKNTELAYRYGSHDGNLRSLKLRS